METMETMVDGRSSYELVDDPNTELNGCELPRRTWLRLNRIRTGHGCCAYLIHKWKFVESPLCQCGETETMEHYVPRL